MTDPGSLPNLNAAWSHVLIDQLVRHEVSGFVIAPGARSAPLVVAAARHETARTQVVVDERGAGYLAVGMARATGRPAVVVTTSGTALSNLMPAVTEADRDRIPLIVVSADRPAELRDAGANQTIRQPGLFGEATRWHLDLPCPGAAIGPAFVATSVAAAMRHALAGGPVHLNQPFREPLAPSAEGWERGRWAGFGTETTEPYTVTYQGFLRPDESALSMLTDALRAGDGVVVLAGDGVVRPRDRVAEALARVVEASGWGVMADVRSGLRLGWPHRSHLSSPVAGRHAAPVGTVIQFGDRITSRPLASALATSRRWVVVTPSPERIDPAHRVTEHIQADPLITLDALAEVIGAKPREGKPIPGDDDAHAAVDAALDGEPALVEPWIARWLSRNLDPHHGLFLGSSLPVRTMDTFAVPDGPAVPLAANRGASGIDGSIASAVGFAAGLRRPVTALIGDQSFLHDLSSVPLVATADPPVTLVVVNNGGGAIFRRLPIATEGDVFDRFFAAAHARPLAPVADALGVASAVAGDRERFGAAYRALAAGAGGVLEATVDPETSGRAHRNAIAAAEAAAR